MKGPLILTGMHRSGTSFLARLFNRAGLFLGDQLMGAAPSNPYGHFEDLEVARFHASILRRYGYEFWEVDRPLEPDLGGDDRGWMRGLVEGRGGSERPWGFKDPRACFFLAAWKRIAPVMKSIAIYRDYGEVVASLERRHGALLFAGKGPATAFSWRFWERPDEGLKLWVAYNTALLRYVDAHADDCIVVPFAGVRNGLPIVRWVTDRWSIPLREVPLNEAYDPTIVRSRVGPVPVADEAVARAVADTWDALEARSEPAAKEAGRSTGPSALEVVGEERWRTLMQIDLRDREIDWLRERPDESRRDREALRLPLDKVEQTNDPSVPERDLLSLLRRLRRSSRRLALRLRRSIEFRRKPGSES